MQNFNWTQFTKRITVKAGLDTLYNAWTKSAELEKWFLSRAVFYTADREILAPSVTAAAGNGYEWNWYTQGYHEEGTVTQVNGTDFLEFTFAGNCIVQVQLTAEKDYVLVELTQSNIPTDDSSKANIRLGCAFGWTFYLVNLKSVLEGGLDLRNKDTDLTGLINN